MATPVNTHFGKVVDISRAFEYMGALTIDDVFRSLILATLKSSNNSALHTTYDQILDDLDDDKDLTLRTSKPPRTTLRTSPVKTEKYNKYKHQGGNDLAVFLCNTLEKHGEQSGKVLHRVGLAGDEWNEPASVMPSSWPPRNTSPARSPVTQTMTMTPTMTLPMPMNRMIEPEDLFDFVGSVQGLFFFLFMFPLASGEKPKPIVFSSKLVDLQACMHSHPLPRSSS
jgi:hypothetical protein